MRGGLALALSSVSLGALLGPAAVSASANELTSAAQLQQTAATPLLAQATELSVLGWGGLYGDALAKWVNQPFQDAHGVNIVFQEQRYASESLAKIQAEQSAPTIDVWLTTAALPLQLAKAGALDELTADQVPNVSDEFPFAVQTYQGAAYGAGIHVGSQCIMVDNKRIRSFIPDYNIGMLNSWSFAYRPELRDQLSVEGFEGNFGSAMIMMSKVYGGSESDEDAFFAAMRKLAPNIHALASGIGYSQLFLSGEIVAAVGVGTDVQEALNNGVPVDVGWPLDPLGILLDYVVAIKNGPAGNDFALQYINAMLQPDTMPNYDAQLGEYCPNSKAVQPSFPGVPPLTSDQLKAGWLIDYDTAIANYDSWLQRYNKEIVPLYGG
jgi:spermidine/putrescine-binding protein